jgi:hypothetical protein
MIDITLWCARPTKTQIEWAVAEGVTALNVMVHDASPFRDSSSKFKPDAGTDEACRRIVDAGLVLELTAWAMPHRDYIAAACDWLTQSSVDYGVRVIWWDAEEPWTQARGGLDPAAAADLIDLAGAREGVTGIGYAPKSLDPLLARADVVGPQAYATTREGSLSHARIPGVLAGWAKRAPTAAMIPALAGYSQPPNGLRLAWEAAGRPKRIQIWALRHLVGRSLLWQIRG